MSLDFSLKRKKLVSYDNGLTFSKEFNEVFSVNITHNLTEMADKAKIYEALWRPYRIKSTYSKDLTREDEFKFEYETDVLAKEIIPFLEKGLKKLKAKPEYYKKFNSFNGWGMYEHFVPFVEKCLNACKENPELIVITDR